VQKTIWLIFRTGGGSKHKLTPINHHVTYLDGSIPAGVVKNSNLRDHCTETFEVANDIGPSIGTEKRKLV
jgi:hypothetical protein